MRGVVAIFLVLVIASLMLERSDAAVTCGELQTGFSPCISFVISLQPEPSEECCSSVHMLESKVRSTEDKRSACKCMKDVAEKMPKLGENVNELFSKCNAPPPFPVGKDMDCDRLSNLLFRRGEQFVVKISPGA